MARRKLENRNVRSLVKMSGGRSYSVTLPVEVVRRWRWKHRQKLQLMVSDKRRRITIEDWRKGSGRMIR